jgi:FtsP/CotA-like multicopper oxidase with cupredoxin domain
MGHARAYQCCYIGKYFLHRHILDHEDQTMMEKARARTAGRKAVD